MDRHLHILHKAHYDTEEVPLQELLITQLVTETAELLARGLHRNYQRRDEVLESPRERIDFSRYVDAAGNAHAALPCIHHPRTLFTPLHAS